MVVDVVFHLLPVVRVGPVAVLLQLPQPRLEHRLGLILLAHVVVLRQDLGQLKPALLGVASVGRRDERLLRHVLRLLLPGEGVVRDLQLGEQRREALAELVEVHELGLVAGEVILELLAEPILTKLVASGLQLLKAEVAILIRVDGIKDVLRLLDHVGLQQAHGSEVGASLPHVVPLHQQQRHLRADRRQPALVDVRRHEGSVLQHPVCHLLRDPACHVQAPVGLQEQRHVPGLRPVGVREDLQSLLAERARGGVEDDDAGVFGIREVLPVHLDVHLLRPLIGQELVDVADACAAHHALHRDPVPARELDLEVLQELDLQLVRAGAPRPELPVLPLAGVALVLAVRVRYQVALAEARARADAGLWGVQAGLGVVEGDHLVICEGQHAVALGNEVVDELHSRDAQLLLNFPGVHDPVQVREAALAVDDDAGEGEDRHGRFDPFLEATVLGEEHLHDLLEGLEHDVGVLDLLDQLPWGPLLGDHLRVWRDPVQHHAARGPTAVCRHDELCRVRLPLRHAPPFRPHAAPGHGQADGAATDLSGETRVAAENSIHRAGRL
mmetsp:Transcript_107642/g.270014  ORF Transcript_107642/g.270014 Transcript_107642/m.270014 type:complete len:556 (-) Transcript_107642:694-2361(-)